ncbi:MAG: hypothetical protein ACLPX9_10945 [Rhodomicrobium sp.]
MAQLFPGASLVKVKSGRLRDYSSTGPYIVAHYEGGGVDVIRVHHAIADGIAAAPMKPSGEFNLMHVSEYA